MKIFTHISVLALAIWSFPLWAGTPMSAESASSGTTDVKPYSGKFFCRAAMPVDIQCPGFVLKAEMDLKEL